MLFNSVPFLFFFTIVTAIYFSIPQRYRWAWLLSASCFFYMSWEPGYVLLILLTTLVTYYVSIQMGKRELKAGRKKILILILVFNVGLLFIFKYFEFFNESLKGFLSHLHLAYPISASRFLIPIGISFYIFKSLSYVIDVYRGDVRPERHLGFFALYVSFFPQLLAGPIERATRLIPQFYEKVDFDYPRVTHGLKLMLWGFFQKMVIADNVARLVDSVYNHPTQHGGLALAIATVLFAFQIYCDFSGYSDIAIGTAQVLGFTTMNNFNRPYFATSVPDFWRRWHISLSSWFRDYLYIPLGGNRVSTPRWYFNLFIVLLICGLWHGANSTFIVWGGLHGFYLVFSAFTQKARVEICQVIGLSKMPRVHQLFRIVTTFFLVCFAWVFFRANTLSDAFYIISRLFIGWGDLPGAWSGLPFWSGQRFEFIVGLMAIVVLMGAQLFEKKGPIVEIISTQPSWIRWPIYYGILLSILLLGEFGSKQFIYFQF